MGSFEDFGPGRVTSPRRPALPLKLLRHLLFSHELGIGSRVLVADCCRLLPTLGHLGIDAMEFDEAVDPMTTGRGRFDVVLVGRLRAYEDNLFSPAALRATAGLLTHARPGGYLVLLARYGSDETGRVPNHTPGCYRRHLEAFPGSSSTRDFPDTLTRINSWRQLLTRRPRSGFLTATVQRPEQTLPLAGLQHLADAVAQSAPGPCCAGAAISARWQNQQRKAA